jgi:ADP-heptose:LPS heptosyltransferase
LFLLYFLKKLIEGSIVDKYIRLAINFLAPYYYKKSYKIDFSNNTEFVFICYGGLGDCILTFPFLIELSSKYPVTIFIENSFKEISSLLNKNIEVKIYLKKEIAKELKKFQSLKANFILIQQSPILEFIFFHYYLKKPPTIGFIYNQNTISYAGISFPEKKIKSLNKIFKYKSLLESIFSINIENTRKYKKSYLENQFKVIDYQKKIEKKYYILSPTKNYKWKMGSLDFKEYAELIIKLYEQNNLIPVIVGTKIDSGIISNILDHVPKKIIIKNLIGKTSIRELISIIKKAQFVISNDNGIHHLANFLNVRTLTLYTFSSHEVYNWSKKNSEYIANAIYKCMPCIGTETGPFDNYPFKCPYDIRCKNTITGNNIIKKLRELSWIN